MSHMSSNATHGGEQLKPPPAPEELDRLYTVLSNARRRAVLRHLIEEGGESTLSDLAEATAAEENGMPVVQLTSDLRKRTYVALYQCHLPKLADLGIVEYNQERGTVELLEEPGALVPHLTFNPESQTMTQNQTVGQCKKCEEAISSDVKECPGCGYNPASQGKWAGTALIIAGTLLVLVHPYIGIPVMLLGVAVAAGGRTLTPSEADV